MELCKRLEELRRKVKLRRRRLVKLRKRLVELWRTLAVLRRRLVELRRTLAEEKIVRTSSETSSQVMMLQWEKVEDDKLGVVHGNDGFMNLPENRYLLFQVLPLIIW